MGCCALWMAAAPDAGATVGITPVEPVERVVKLRYKLRCQENHTTSAGLKIFFTGFTVYTPGAADVYQLEANLYSMWIEYADQGCAPWPPQQHGPNHFGEAGLWASIPDYARKGRVGVRPADANTLRLFPRISTGIDNIPGLTKIETISQTNLNGRDLELEFSRGEVFHEPLSGWGARIDPDNAAQCLAELLSGVTYRKWHLSCRMGEVVFRWEFAVPDENGRYVTPWRLLDFVTEFFNQPPFFQVFAWDVEVQQEGSPLWRPIKKWRMNHRPAPTPNEGYGCRLATYRDQPVLEFSNDGTGPYFQLGDVFELPAELDLDRTGALTIRGSAGTRYVVQHTPVLPATYWTPLIEVVLLDTPRTVRPGLVPDLESGYLRTAVTQTTNRLVWVPAGTFRRGSPESEVGRNGDETRHAVTLTEGFWISRYEVTQGEYAALMGSNPSTFPSGADYPVESLRWTDASQYCAQLTAREAAAGRLPEGYVYRLPTEAEWECACRAGTETPFHSGTILTGDMANFDGREPYPPVPGGDPNGTARGRTTIVGAYPGNAFGLHDMHGNVFEWCQDWAGAYPAGAVTDPVGPATGTLKIFRGGGWGDSGVRCRSAIRWMQTPDFMSYAIGFRVVLGKP